MKSKMIELPCWEQDVNYRTTEIRLGAISPSKILHIALVEENNFRRIPTFYIEIEVMMGDKPKWYKIEFNSENKAKAFRKQLMGFFDVNVIKYDRYVPYDYREKEKGAKNET